MKGTLADLIPLICSCMRNKDLLSMALSSHALMKPALDTLWRDVNMFKPLICCLPDDLLERRDGVYGPTYHLRRQMAPQDLDRYLKVYAARIRTAFLFGANKTVGQCILSIEVLHGLSIATQFIPGALSPNIQNVVAYPLDRPAGAIGDGYADMSASYMFLFTGEKLVELMVVLDLPSPGANPLYTSALSFAVGRCPGIESLTIIYPTPLSTTGATSTVNQFITAHTWTQLETLALTSLSGDIVTSIATLPRLRVIILWEQSDELPLRYAIERHPIGPPITNFPLLEILLMKPKISLRPAVAFLQHLPRGNRLKYLIIRSLGNITAPIGVVQAFFSEVAYHCNPSTLERLELEAVISSSGAPEADRLDIDVTQFIDVAQLFPFTKLKEVMLGGSCFNCRFTPTEVANLVAAWPRLTHLILMNGKMSLDIPPQIGFEHILQLAQGLPHLYELGLRFDATQVRGDELGEGGPFMSLREIDVDSSPIVSPSRVLHSLRANFPRLRKLISPLRQHDTRKIVADRWAAVAAGIAKE